MKDKNSEEEKLSDWRYRINEFMSGNMKFYQYSSLEEEYLKLKDHFLEEEREDADTIYRYYLGRLEM